MKRHTIAPETLAELETRTADMACPKCGTAGSVAIVERYDLRRPDPPGFAGKFAYGPKGMPLWAWCGVCDAHGRVADMTHATGLPS